MALRASIRGYPKLCKAYGPHLDYSTPLKEEGYSREP